MFNIQGNELMIILLVALVVLGPEKLPEAMRKAGQFAAQVRKMSAGFQQEFRNAVDEPVKELRETANLLRESADFAKLADGDRDTKPLADQPLADQPLADTPSAGSSPGEVAPLREANTDADGPVSPFTESPPNGAADTEPDDGGDG